MELVALKKKTLAVFHNLKLLLKETKYYHRGHGYKVKTPSNKQRKVLYIIVSRKQVLLIEHPHFFKFML